MDEGARATEPPSPFLRTSLPTAATPSLQIGATSQHGFVANRAQPHQSAPNRPVVVLTQYFRTGTICRPSQMARRSRDGGLRRRRARIVTRQGGSVGATRGERSPGSVPTNNQG